MPAIPPLAEQGPALDTLFAAAIRRILDDEPLDSFCDWFTHAMGSLVQSTYPLPPGEEADGFRYQRTVARALWSGLPVPSNRWRPRPLPKVERNDPCHCGSGRKFKQCCAEFSAVAPPFDSDGFYALALAQAEPAMLTPAQVRLVPPQALGMAAEAWNQNRQPDRTVAVLAPLFGERNDLDGRHELAFDILMDALQTLGQETRRQALAQHVGQCRDKALATSARCREVSMLADRGEMDEAWELFRSTQRLSPNDPQLWHLELTLLLSQGRSDEARLRGPLLAAKARKAGMTELSGRLLQLAEGGLAAAYEAAGAEGPEDPEHLAWIALCDRTPEAISPEACRALYRIDENPPQGDGQPPGLTIKAKRTLADLQRRWRRRFAVEKPILTALQGDATALLDDLDAAAAFLIDNPTCWLSIEVLDDLLLAAAELCDWEAPPAILRATRRLATHAVAVLRALVGEAPALLEWIDSDARPLLRVLAQAIEIARLVHDQPAVETLGRWSLQMNPNDNHGWRDVLVPLWLAQSRFDDALALLERYPDDMPPAGHHRALALFGLGRTDEAQAVLRAAHAEFPVFLQALLPAVLDQPEPETGPGLSLGGAMAAWYFRVENRPVWHRTGALAWARDLNLRAPPARKAAKPKATKSAKSGKVRGTAAGSNRFGLRHEAQLRKAFADYPHLHGLLMAVAWSPGLVMPTQWMQSVTDMRVAAPPGLTPTRELEAMNADLNALMLLYNSLNDTVLATQPQQPAPLQDVLALTAGSDDAVCAWAGGFVRGAELAAGAWRQAGRPVSSGKGTFGELYALAARAGLAPEASWQARKDDGQPLLIGLEDAPTPPSEILKLALLDLWRVIAPLRHAQLMRSRSGGTG